ncbi:MAG: carboxypeptidase-like regulatory domain-containing protein [Vicinamibacterales bacterium]
MKQCCTIIAFCMLLAGCDAASRSVVGPEAQAPADATMYTLTGRIQDANGAPVSGAAVGLTGQAGSGRTTSDERGEYRFTVLRGLAVLTITKEDFVDYTTSLFMTADQTLTITLHHRGAALTLTAGATLHGTIQGPPCDPAWDATAPCVAVHFIPPETGLYDLVLTWKGPSAVDMLVDGDFALYWESYTGEIRATVAGQAGIRCEIRIHAYHLPVVPEPFELSAWLRPQS